MINVAIIDSDRYVRNGLMLFFNSFSDIDVKLQVDGFDEIKDIDKSIDVIVFDFASNEIIKNIGGVIYSKNTNPLVNHIAFINDGAGNKRRRIENIGILNIISKGDNPNELIKAIRRKRVVESEKISLDMSDVAQRVGLTTMEYTILQALSYGFNNAEVSLMLARSQKTISAHKRAAMRKLGIKNNFGLAAYLNEIN